MFVQIFKQAFVRRAVLGLLVLFFTHHNTHGQKVSKQTIDSLNRLAFELRVSEKNTAIASAKKAIELNENGQYEKELYESYLYLGLNYTNLSRYDSAITLLRLCDNYFEHSFQAGLTQYYLGINFSNLRSFAKAKAYFDKALELFSLTGSVEYEAYVYNSLGVVEGRQSNLDQALEFFLKAYDKKLSNGLHYDEELNNIAIVYRMMEKYDKALEFSRKSLDMAESLEDSLGMAQTYVSIGNIFKSMSLPDSSLSYYDRSFRLASKKGYENQMASALINKAGILNMINQSDSAILMLESISGKINDQGIQESIFRELAQIYFDIDQLSKAIDNAKDAYRLGEINDNLSLKKEITLLIAMSYKKLKQFDSAYTYQAKHNAYLTEYHETNSSSNISDLQVRIETLEKDHEIAILTKEKELETIKRNRLLIILVSFLLLGIVIVILTLRAQKERNQRQKLEEEKLRFEIEKAKGSLYKQTIHMIHVNNCLDEIECIIRKRDNKSIESADKKILSTIKFNKSLDQDWKNFNDYFSNVHMDFYEKLNDASSELSIHDKRTCALLKLGLSNREISTILNIEAKSVSMVKYRIKKKLKLDEEIDLGRFVQAL